MTTLTLDEAATVLKTTPRQSHDVATAARVRHLLAYEPLTGIFRWRVTRAGKARAGTIAGNVTPAGYLRISIDGLTCFAHRLAWLYMTGEWPADQIDHRDGSGLNNRFENLRAASNLQNSQNRGLQRNNRSGVLGVSYNAKRARFQSHIMKGGRRRNLGWFATLDEAAAAYAAAKHALHEFQPIARGAPGP